MKHLLILFQILIFVGCTGPGADSGFAPGAAIIPVTTPAPADHIKYGEVVTTTSNGYEVAMDTTDPIEQKTLSNGWTVEVKYE